MSNRTNSRSWPNFVVVPRRELSIDLANTVAWRGSAPSESLHNVAAVLAWLASSKTLPAPAVAGLRRWFDAHPSDAATVFGEVIEVRETIYRLLHAVATASAPTGEDLGRLNRALTEAAPRTHLNRASRSFGWRIDTEPTAASMLAPALWSAADILVSSDCTRVRQCTNHHCLWLFLDDSKNGTRRWCSMQACGNRAKAHRHYLRQKAK
jgi:predicted RNA-binding Zn ribbon-like protein